MRLAIWLASAFFSLNSWAAGGDSVGNGGVLWACVSGSGDQTLHAAVLTDLHEAKAQHQWTLIKDPGGDAYQVYQARKAWLAATLPELFNALKSRFQYVEDHLAYIDAELLPTNDYNYATKPLASSCSQGQWKPVNIANFREEDQQVLINNELWTSSKVPTLSKAALLFHEAIYYWMRTYYGAINSDRARKITGVLFTTMAPDAMKREIGKVIGTYPNQPDGRFVCVLKNAKRNQIYVAYAADEDEAAITVRMRCQNEADAKWCQASSLACEEVVSTSANRRCLAENVHTHKLYQGWGRALIEAQFNAHMACYIGSQAQGAQPQACPEFEFMECK